MSELSHLSRWLPWIGLAAFTALWVARWPAFPLVLDPYYHLLIARQVAEAGGPIAYEPWEYAPVGRPHLYPPVLHLILAGLLKLGCEPITAIRLVSVSVLPGLLASVFLVSRRLFGGSAALACLWVALAPFSFHLHSVIALAATLGLIELLWLVDAMERGRLVSAGLWLTLLWYTHLGMPWIALLAVGCAILLRPELRRSWRAVALGAGLALPWLWHVWRHRAFLHVVARHENALIEIAPLLIAAAGAGAWVCWRRRREFVWPLACLAAFALMAPRHAYRWLNGEGSLPLILLAGVGIDWLAHRFSVGGRRYPLMVSAGLAVALAAGPIVGREEHGWRWTWGDSAPARLLGWGEEQAKPLELGLYSPPVQRLVELVASSSQPGEILWSNEPYALGLIAALVGRPMSTAMFAEVPPARPLDPPASAHLVVWFKIPTEPGSMTLEALRRHPLKPVAEDAMALLLRRDGVAERAGTPRAVLPLGAALALLGAALTFAVSGNLYRSCTNLIDYADSPEIHQSQS